MDVDEAAVQALAAGLGGRMLRPGDAGYDAARRHYNALIDKRPAMIVQCAGVADVIAAVTFARDQHLPLAVRGGGHNVAGRCLIFRR
jgi:FAD/FMN-containing dehydrogenase